MLPQAAMGTAVLFPLGVSVDYIHISASAFLVNSLVINMFLSFIWLVRQMIITEIQIQWASDHLSEEPQKRSFLTTILLCRLWVAPKLSNI